LGAEVRTEIITVGIGASAGGLEAIRELLENVPEQSDLAFVIIQHLAETQASLLTEILSRYTKIPVQKVENGVKIEPNHVYVIPPGVSMIISDGVLELKPRGIARKPIDEFFNSLALEKKSRAIGIILSGTGNDGTEGTRAIKAEGGITFAQDPKTAQYRDMPQSAISSESIHFILSPKQIANELMRVVKHPELVRQKITEEPAIEGLTTLQKIFSMLQNSFKIDFAHYKKSTIMRRITRRIIINKLNTIEEYAKYLRLHPEELKALFDDLLIGVTEFFREPKTFEILEETVFPEVLKKRVKTQPLRVWLPGCATGEEVYSFAIVLQEFLDEQNLEIQAQIFGTDVNERSIDKARRAVYPKSIEAKVTSERLRKFFTTSNGNYQVAKRIRDLCIFAVQDLTRDPPFSGLDIILCRNVLIYFDTVLQEKIIPTFHYGLKPNGYLILGESETVGKFAQFFEPIERKSPIFRKKEAFGKIEVPIGRFELLPTEKRDLRAFKEAEPINLITSATDNILMSDFVPATFVVNNTMDIVVTRGHIQPYITIEPGTPSFSVAKMVRKELRPVVQSSIYRARKEQKEIQDTVNFKRDDSEITVKVQVKPFTVPKVDGLFFLVAFFELKAMALAPEKAVAMEEAEGAKDQQIRDLSEALESTKQTLQSTIEQQESTNEELRSALEEVQSSNEELQSTNEELETAKEELQSTNEELNTVNSELKERNQNLTQISDDLANLLDNVDAAIIIVDNDLRIKRFTNPAQEFFRLIPSDIGRKITDIRLNIPVDDLENDLSSVIKNLQATKREIRANNNWYQLRVRPYITEEKKIQGAVTTIIDITDLKKAEEELEFQAELLANVQDAVVAADKDFNLVYWSKAAEELFGWEAKEVVGRPYKEVLQSELSDLAQKQALDNLLNAGSSKSEEIYQCKGGKRINVDVRSTVLKNKQGQLMGIVSSYRDVSERKLLESKIEEYNKNLEHVLEERTKQLKDAERMATIGQVAGMVGHDIRNPLQAVISDLYLARSNLSALPEDQNKEGLSESLEDIEKSIEYINKIVADLQDYARPLRPTAKETNLANLCTGITSKCNIPNNIEFSCDIDQQTTQITTDPELLTRALTNLVTNAVQAMPKSGKLTVRSYRQQGDTIIEVKDTGVGIPEEAKAKLFTPLFTTKPKGQGFGLAVVKRVIEVMNGTISVESQKDKGTTFTIRLPPPQRVGGKLVFG
jgi:two-component system CheB/CheR fusion protein